MNRTIKNKGKELELNIDWILETIRYNFKKTLGGNMKLTIQDIEAIRIALQPEFDQIRTSVSDLEAKLTTKMNEQFDNLYRNNKTLKR